MLTNELISQVKYNCNVSDANYWGYFSMCNLLLRLRELYYHEHDLELSSKAVKEDVGEWISIRESLWEDLEEKEFEPIKIRGKEFDPFDLEKINEILIEENLLYGAGYGLLKKPVFFIGKIQSRHTMEDKNVWIIHNEICRDLAPPFAMSQGENIFIRKDILKGYLYNKFLELKTRSENDPLRLAFEHFGCPYMPGKNENVTEDLSRISDEISKILIWHEIGEINERDHSNAWLDIIAASEDRLTEFRLRGIKDILSDTSPEGTLPSILKAEDKGLFYFYVSLLDETRKAIFPEILDAARQFSLDGKWTAIEHSVNQGRDKAEFLMKEILDLWSRNSDIKEVRKYLMESPITACKLR
ncbi:MAG: hypothetical protein OEZ34_08505 [Spirochaetia bacterium]|nr:hypothetical protein [Spirochaetia bacterium]